MSGPICPDCTCTALKELDVDKYHCEICGWDGKSPPRKIMDAQTSHEIWEETQRQMELRKKKQLFYFRIYLRGKQEEQDQAEWDIMGLLGMEQMRSGDYMFFYLTEKPAEDVMDRIKAMKAVRKIKIY